MMMDNNQIIDKNKKYWNDHADYWFGTTALPQYGVRFVTEEDLHLFGDVSGKRLLEICCGSGHSLKYHADRNAGELWGVDLSQKQLDNAKSYFDESYFKMPVHDSEIVLCNRKISTYVNALAKAGFVIEQMIEQNDKEVMEAEVLDDKSRKARMLPISVCFKARKL